MLAIILGILKWIGLLILILLGILVTLILLVLLVPVRYRAEGSYHEKLKGQGAVTWLLHLISIRVWYEEALRIVVRICGFRVFDSGREEAADEGDLTGAEESDSARDGEAQTQEKHEKQEKQDKQDKKGKQDKHNHKKQDKKNKSDGVIRYEEEPENKKPEDKKSEDKKPEDKKPEDKNSEDKQPDDEDLKTGKSMEAKPENICQSEPQVLKKPDAKSEQKKAAGTIQSKLQSILKKIRVTFHRFCDTLKGIKDKKDTILEFIHDEENQNTFRLVKKQVFALLKHILPRKLQGKARFGFDDPYTTGQILTYISPFYGLYAKHLQLIPSFEEPILDGELKLKGRIRIGTVLAIGIRVLLDKNFRRLLKKFRES